MLTLVSSVLGFGSSFLPSILKFFEAKRDQNHELAMMDKQLESRVQLGNQKMQMVETEATAREFEALHKEHAQITKKASQFWVNFSSSVRPVMTYLLFFEFMLLTYLLAAGYIGTGMYSLVWSEPISAIWGSVVCFWFGSRTFNPK